MEADELYRVLKQQPFAPVRMYVSDGSSYDISHPDQVIVSRRAAHIGMRRNGSGPFQQVAIVANVHITRIEPLEGGKSRARRRAT
jgi:hypothetical protein